MRKFLIRLVVIVLALAGLYWWAAVDNRMPADASYELDLSKVRALADSLPGEKPSQIRYEKILAFKFPEAMTLAGAPWDTVEMPVYSYQLVYPDHTALIDSAMPRAIAKPDFMVAYYDDKAYDRVQQAIDKAALIVITHEHMDHIGGVAAHGKLPELLTRLKLTDVQIAHPEKMSPSEFPPDAFNGYQPLHYDHYQAVAPGMVLIAAPGHTPGSQLVYVKLADGRELLFLGDLTWRMHNIEVQGERPRWATGLLIGEDRHAVFGELKALHALSQLEPGVKIIPGHDGATIDALTQAGYLQAGFIP